MLNITTGVPGAGKTLYTIMFVRDYVEAEHKEALKKDPEAQPRSVYFYGIKELKLPWYEMESTEEWYNLPDHSIILIDEAQNHFRPLPNGAKRPQHYEEFATHRHRGFDLFLITQEPKFIDSRVRAMCQRHFHLSRSYGLERATLYEWQQVKSDVLTDQLQYDRTAVKTQWSYPKDVYNLYKSAEVHTHKRRLPWKKLIPIGLTFIAFIAVLTIMGKWLWAKRTIVDEIQETASPATGMIENATTVLGSRPQSRTTLFDDPISFKPSIEGLPMSAPAYASKVRVQDYPRVDGCMLLTFPRSITCTCNDQRGNRIQTTQQACISFVENGFFDFSVSARGAASQRPSIAQRAAAGANQRPEAAATTPR